MSSSWAWKYEQNKDKGDWESFSDIQCMMIEKMYQKYIKNIKTVLADGIVEVVDREPDP